MYPQEYGGRSGVGKYTSTRVSSHAPQTPTQAQLWALATRLAGRARVRVAHWNGRRRKWEYRARDEQHLTASVPNGPAAVMLYDAQGQCQTLVADVDVTGTEGQALTHAIVALMERCGARVIVDRSPAGKHHVYLPLRDGLSVEDAGRIAKALARRFPGVDPLPHTTGAVSGCIRTPGSPYKTGDGHQQLVTDYQVAQRTLMTRSGSDVIRALEAALVDELAAVRREAITLATPLATLEAENPVDQTPLDGPVLSPRMSQIAREGTFEDAGYADRSTARMAVLTAARRAGYDHPAVIARIENGTWPGLRALYANATTAWRTLLTRTEWPKAVALVAATPKTPTPVRHCTTSEVLLATRGGPTPADQQKSTFDEHRFIRRLRAVMADVHLVEFTGRTGRLRRLLLQTLAAAAHQTGSREVEFGVRSYSMSLPHDSSHVARALSELRAEDDPWITLERDAHGTSADLYRLRIPDRYQQRAEALTLPAGKVHGLRPAFRVLGAEASEVFEAIERGATTLAQVTTTTGLARSTVYEHAGILAAWDLLTRHDDGTWTAHTDRLPHVAGLLGADATVAALLTRIRAERAVWVTWLSDRHTRAADSWHRLMQEGPPDDPLEEAA